MKKQKRKHEEIENNADDESHEVKRSKQLSAKSNDSVKKLKKGATSNKSSTGRSGKYSGKSLQNVKDPPSDEETAMEVDNSSKKSKNTKSKFEKQNKVKTVNQKSSKVDTLLAFKEQVKKVQKAAKQANQLSDSTQKHSFKDKKVQVKEEIKGEKKIVELSFKERKQIRKQQGKNYDNTKKALRLWEKLRIGEQSQPERQKTCDDLYRLVKGKAVEYVNAHDTARVIQTLIKYGSPVQKNQLFDELKANIVGMMKSVYAKFIVRKFLKYGTKGHRDCIFKAIDRKSVV